MNGQRPPPGIPTPRLGPLALNLKNQMLRINTNKRLAALNSIGVSSPEPEKNLPRLSNLAPFPIVNTPRVVVPEPIISLPSILSARATNWVPSGSAIVNNIPDWQKPPPPMHQLLDYLRNGGRLYREQFIHEDWRRVWDFIGLHRDIENIRYWSKDNKTGEKVLHPYFYIPKSAVSKTRRKRKQSSHTRRRRHR